MLQEVQSDYLLPIKGDNMGSHAVAQEWLAEALENGGSVEILPSTVAGLLLLAVPEVQALAEALKVIVEYSHQRRNCYCQRRFKWFGVVGSKGYGGMAVPQINTGGRVSGIGIQQWRRQNVTITGGTVTATGEMVVQGSIGALGRVDNVLIAGGTVLPWRR